MMATMTIEMKVSFRRWVAPSITALAWTCAVLSFVLPHRWIDRIAAAAATFVARFGLRVEVANHPKNG